MNIHWSNSIHKTGIIRVIYQPQQFIKNCYREAQVEAVSDLGVTGVSNAVVKHIFNTFFG